MAKMESRASLLSAVVRPHLLPFQPSGRFSGKKGRGTKQNSTIRCSHCSSAPLDCSRRSYVLGSVLLGVSAFCKDAAAKGNYESMEQLKGKDYGKERQRYSDYTRTESGLQYQDIKVGQGQEPAPGSTVSIDWDGYTIGYYGRPFQARNKAKGGSFGQGADRELYAFKLGSQTAIPAVEEAVAGMKPGGIRRLIVPVELGYPDNDFNKKGPKPTTFSGQRALDFVLKNKGLIDKTLLIDVELVKVS